MARPHGTKNIETPDAMWEYFVLYKTFTKKHPYKVKDWVGGMAKAVTRTKERPLTLEGFSVYCFENGITKNINDYFGNKNKGYEDYSDICSRIKEVIRQDQIEGGMAGMFNPSITQRLNSLVERVQEDGSKEVTINVKYEKKKAVGEE